jgi:hypothetical protein
MSLKAFHIVFVFFSTALALGVGAWCIYVDMVQGVQTYLVGAIISFVSAVGLVIYGFWFYRKMKRLGIIS